MFNEENVRDKLYNKYVNLGNITMGKMAIKDRLHGLIDVLDYVISDVESFNKDELIVTKNILSIAKQILNDANKYKNMSLLQKRVCYDNIEEINAVLNKKSFK